MEREAISEFPIIDVRTYHAIPESQAAANAYDYAVRVLKCRAIKTVVPIPYSSKILADHSVGPKK